ncbi:MAG: TldD/PmbA family protein [Burkholderiaceae bacterium]|nr:TldD/PmbA family protein [Burkholderiaceae bacterium]
MPFPRPPQPGARVSLRLVEASSESLAVVRGVLQPPALATDRGAMVTVRIDGEAGYCATADLSARGLREAAGRAAQWARAAKSRGLSLADDDAWPGADEAGKPCLRYESPSEEPLAQRDALVALLREEADAMRRDARIVHWAASLDASVVSQSLWIDGEAVSQQTMRYVVPNLEATAAQDGRAQTRTLAGQYNGFCRQGGAEALRDCGFAGGGARVAGEAIELLHAPNCPSGVRDLLLSPDQMMLQIHESIGHPLELDRILGDERNFAGTSFVTPQMFGRYRYGSLLLNVSFDPGVVGQFASYAADDDGEAAHRVMLIENGILQRALGGALSRARARARGFAVQGAASARASGWHRAPIDRMANLNVEAGDASFESMVARTERGIWMRTNASWSIDDARNKFQFGCEWGRLIENGRLTQVVRNPNYRGVSATFWRSLAAVGARETMQVLGTPFCGKGEPGQIVRVGHASPACLFRDVDVFGGEE